MIEQGASKKTPEQIEQERIEKLNQENKERLRKLMLNCIQDGQINMVDIVDPLPNTKKTFGDRLKRLFSRKDKRKGQTESETKKSLRILLVDNATAQSTDPAEKQPMTTSLKYALIRDQNNAQPLYIDAHDTGFTQKRPQPKAILLEIPGYKHDTSVAPTRSEIFQQAESLLQLPGITMWSTMPQAEYQISGLNSAGSLEVVNRKKPNLTFKPDDHRKIVSNIENAMSSS